MKGIQIAKSITTTGIMITKKFIDKKSQTNEVNPRKIYSLENILTGEIETGTRKELMLKTQLNDDAISKLLREKQKRRGNWKLV